MNETANTEALPAAVTYDCRAEIKYVGGKFDGRVWTVTVEQLATLREMAAASGRRFNKRDTQFSRSWAVVEAAMAAEVAS